MFGPRAVPAASKAGLFKSPVLSAVETSRETPVKQITDEEFFSFLFVLSEHFECFRVLGNGRIHFQLVTKEGVKLHISFVRK